MVSNPVNKKNVKYDFAPLLKYYMHSYKHKLSIILIHHSIIRTLACMKQKNIYK